MRFPRQAESFGPMDFKFKFTTTNQNISTRGGGPPPVGRLPEAR